MNKAILVIENDPSSMDLMIFVLNYLGYTVIPALNGPAGLAIARGEVPALILCDIGMPELDGRGVLRALKSDASVSVIPVVAVTAMTTAGDREALLADGFDGYLSKPIDLGALRHEIARHLAA